MNAIKTSGAAAIYVVLSAVLTCGTAAPGWAQGHETSAGKSGGPQEGIKVHGEWTIVIRNGDGSVASRYEFQNALVNFTVLPTVLAHGGSAGPWFVELKGPASDEQPCRLPLPPPLDGPVQCILAETANAVPNLGALRVSIDGNTLLIQGSVKAQNASRITNVATGLDVCPPSQPPSLQCSPATQNSFTGKDVTSQSISVGANQTIDVTVRISFS